MDIGGAETHILDLATGLSRLGVRVTVLSAGGRSVHRLTEAGILHHRLELAAHSPFRWLRLRRALCRLLRGEHYDILHAHARIPALLLRGLSRYGVGSVVTAHAAFRTFPLSRALCYWGEATIAVSEDIRTNLIHRHAVPAERIRVISNGIDLSRFSLAPRDPTAPIRLLFASRLDSDCARGAELLCRLTPELTVRFPSLRIGIAGGGDALPRIRALADESNRLARARGVRFDPIILHGTVQDMPTLFRSYDILVGVSRVAMEGAASGCAVVLCGNEGYFGILRPENLSAAAESNLCGRSCPPATGEALQRDLEALLASPSACRALGASLADAVRERFDAERMCRETLAVYHRHLHPGGGRKLLLSGYYGCGNPGDDAILLGTAELLHALSPATRVTVLTGSPRRDRRRFALACRSRRSPFAILRGILAADSVWCGGGSLLQNATSRRSLFYYLSILRVSGMLARRPVLYAAGIGPIRGEGARHRTARVLSICRYLSLRDPESMRLLGAMGLDAARLHLGADPSFWMPLPPPSRTDILLASAGIPGGMRILCLVVKGGEDAEPLLPILAAALRVFCRQNALLPLLPILDARRDGAAAERVAAALGGRTVALSEPADAVALMRGARITVSMRLHGLIFSTLAGTPALGLATPATEQKLSSFARRAGQGYLSPEPLSAARVSRQAEEILQDAAAIRLRLPSFVAEERKKAQKDLANLCDMLYNEA